MGYQTDFSGKFDVAPALKPEHREYLKKFNETRRMERSVNEAAKLPDPVREATGLPLGEQAGYFVGGRGFHGQDNDPSVQDHNDPPKGQPGLWCQWTPSGDGAAIEWDEGEKFYDYIEWIKYLIAHFLKPWGYVLNGSVEWHGEEQGDVGRIDIVDNKVTIMRGRLEFSPDESDEDDEE